MSPSVNGGPHLTGEERAALRLAATGLTGAEVGEVMGAPAALAREWLASAVHKLGARSKLEAVLFADRMGLLDSWP
jgi:LuxR family transcriptional regulator